MNNKIKKLIKRAKQVGYKAKPNNAGGVTIFVKEGKLTEDFSQRRGNFRIYLRKEIKRAKKITVKSLKLVYTKIKKGIDKGRWEHNKSGNAVYSDEQVVKQLAGILEDDIKKSQTYNAEEVRNMVLFEGKLNESQKITDNDMSSINYQEKLEKIHASLNLDMTPAYNSEFIEEDSNIYDEEPTVDLSQFKLSGLLDMYTYDADCDTWKSELDSLQNTRTTKLSDLTKKQAKLNTVIPTSTSGYKTVSSKSKKNHK